MAERHSIAQKHTLGKAPRCVRCVLLPGHKRVTVAARSLRPRDRRNSQPAASRPSQLAAGVARGAQRTAR